MSYDFSAVLRARYALDSTTSPLTDATGNGNGLSRSGLTLDTNDKMEGTGSCSFSGSTSYAERMDDSLSSGFPGKCGENNQNFLVTVWAKAHAFDAVNGTDIVDKYVGSNNPTGHGYDSNTEAI